MLANVKTSSNAESIATEFADRFEGLGKLSKVQVQIHLNPDVTPVIQPHRRIPFHLHQKVKDELQHLEDMDVIARVTQPTSWLSPLVAAPKPNNADAVRLGVDMRSVNKAVLSEQDVMPTVDDIISDLNGATKLDVNQGYHQLELTHDTRDATTDPAKVESIIQIEKPTKVPPATAMLGREINIDVKSENNRNRETREGQ